MIRMFVCVVAIVAGAIWPPAGLAQTYPSRPIRFFVPYPPGGGTDIVARVLAQKLQESMGQTVIVENKPGGNEIISTDTLAKSAPDGHTLALVSNAFPINVSLRPKLPFDPARDFIPLTMLVTVPFVMVVHTSVAANSVPELVKLAKSKPGQLNYAHLGSGSPHQLAMEWFKQLAGVDIVGVPYKGVAAGNAAVTAGEVQLAFTGLTAGMAQVKGGRLKALAVSPAKRVSAAPELPTVAEAGYPEFDMTTWYGSVIPAGTPPEIVARLHAELVKALNAPDVRQRFAGIGVDTAPMTPEAFASVIRAETQTWAKIIKAAGVKAD